LCDFVHLSNGCVDLIDPLGLFLRRGGDLADQIGCLADLVLLQKA